MTTAATAVATGTAIVTRVTLTCGAASTCVNAWADRGAEVHFTVSSVDTAAADLMAQAAEFEARATRLLRTAALARAAADKILADKA